MTLYEPLRQKIAPKSSLQQTLILLSYPIDAATTCNLRIEVTMKRLLTEHASLEVSEEYTRAEDKGTPIESIPPLQVVLGSSV